MRLKILGTCAYPGSGQDTFANKLASLLNISVYSMGDVLREICKEKGEACTRENLQILRREINSSFDEKYIAQQLAEKIILNNSPAIITGIRLLDELNFFQSVFDFKLIFVWAEKDVRVARVLARGQEKDPTNHEGVKVQSIAEKNMFDIESLSKRSDCTIDCNMDKKTFLDNFDHSLSLMGGVYLDFQKAITS